MNRSKEMAIHVLSGGHERDKCKAYVLNQRTLNKSQLRKVINSHVWYYACKTAYGPLVANKEVTVMMKEIANESSGT